MSIQDLGSLGELIAAVATLATLAYLALQIRYNSRTVESATEESITTGFNDVNMLVGSSPDLSRLITTGIDTPQALSAEEELQFNFLWRCYMNQYYRLFQLYQSGALAEDRWRVYEKEAALWTATPGGAAWREANPTMKELWQALDKVPVEPVADVRFNRAAATEAGTSA